MSNIKQPCVDGYFYPGNPEILSKTIHNLITSAKSFELPPPKAIIAPHAGYTYSGAIAATIYKTLLPNKDLIKRVVVVGPAHKLSFRGIATTNCDYFSTPLGNLAIDLAAIASILSMPTVQVLEHAFDMEHCLEVQLPFLQTVLKDFKLIPFVIGNAQPQDVANLLLRLWGGRETLIVISSDLSHYYDYNTAQEFDKAASKAITSLAPNDLQDHQACGQLPIKGLLLAAAELKLQAQILDLRNSGDTSGNKDRVVGYGAYYFKETT